VVYYGELAALGTAVCWSFTYVFFTLAVREIGPVALNRLRLAVALLFLVGAHLAVHHTPLPLHAEAIRWGWLTLSGIIGFAVADALLFRALYYLGAHRSSLMMALVPVMSALLAWGIFAEVLSLLQISAIFVTLVGILLVLWRKQAEESSHVAKRYLLGLLFALGAALAQALRYILSKQGLGEGFSVLSTNLMQIFAATVVVWLWALIRGQVRDTINAFRNKRVRWTLAGGAFTGPFLGVTLSLIALGNAPVTPVFLLPLSALVFKEPIRRRAVYGTILAMAGVALLFLV
jgi:drug/metabolite transporter (DMT)-like permease